jgi:Na+/H+ antiporter NhaD/arsenite permease-like protein
LTLVGVTLLFGMAQYNGTLDRLAGFAIRAARGYPALLPLIFFLLTFALSAIGPGNIATVALIVVIGMAVVVSSGVSTLVMAIVICTGALENCQSHKSLTSYL